MVAMMKQMQMHFRASPGAAPTFPGGSKSRVNRAGVKMREGQPTAEDLQVFDAWRAAHRGVLNTFQSILRNRTRYSATVVAQRHKRRSTIVGKLNRYRDMQLARMDDVAGCRLIFKTVDDLYKFRSDFHQARFRHKRRNSVDKYNYIKRPKSTGYRGIHDVYSYDVNSDTGRPLKGLLVELQYRTLIQHAWATTVEVIGFITESQPKFQQGDKRYEEAMAFASEILARSFEASTGPYPQRSDHDVVAEFQRIDREISLLKTLRGLNVADTEITTKRNAILIFLKSGELEVRTYRDATSALLALFLLERDMPNRDVVLVRADTTDDVRLAFRNYFSDAKDFIDLIGTGCQKLLANKTSST